MRSLIIFGLLALLSLPIFGQSGRQHRPLYNLSDTRWLNKGWHFAPGATYVLPTKFNRHEERLVLNDDGQVDTLFSGNMSQKGKFGVYLEAGRHHLTDKVYLIHDIDYGLGFKWFRGQENFEGIMMNPIDSTSFQTANTGLFSEGYVSANFNVNNIIQISDKQFIMNSLGANVDYRLFNSNSYVGPTTGMNLASANTFVAQLHYRFGFGFKIRSGFYVVPSIETPILNIYTFDDGKSTLQYFNSRYRPLIFSVRILLLDKRKSQDCTGKGNGKTGHQLWDKKMGKKYK